MIVFGTVLLALIAWAITKITPNRSHHDLEPPRPAEVPARFGWRAPMRNSLPTGSACASMR